MPSSQATSTDSFVVSRNHLTHAGFFDEFGRELTHAHLLVAVRDLLGDALIKRIREVGVEHPDVQDATHGRLRGRWMVERFDAPIEYYAAKLKGSSGEHINFHELSAADQVASHAAMRRDVRPRIVSEFEETFENLFLTAGINTLWTIAEGGASSANTGSAAAGANAVFNNTQAMIGVGDSTTAAATAQTDLQAATNKTYVGMDATYPIISTNSTTFRATFGSSLANFSWQEFVINNRNGSNSTTSGGTTLDRVVSVQGTKVSGQTWVPSMTLSIS
jgi:hypothetical protein